MSTWNPHGNPPPEETHADASGADGNVVAFPKTAVVAKDDQRQSYENLLRFLANNAHPDAEIAVADPDELFGQGGASRRVHNPCGAWI